MRSLGISDSHVQAEETFRPHDADACRMRLERLRFEVDAYLTRLNAGKTVLILRLERDEQQKRERAAALTAGVVDHYTARAEARAAAPADDSCPLSTLPGLGSRR